MSYKGSSALDNTSTHIDYMNAIEASTLKLSSDEHERPSASRRDSMADINETGYDLHDDVYSMMFLAKLWTAAFLYAVMVFLLKIALFSFLAYELSSGDGAAGSILATKSGIVLAAQFLMIPVAVAIQEDLISSFALIANIKYDKRIMRVCPGATSNKWVFASSCRILDGFYSLSINFVLLLQAEAILPLFLNFAALQFLQTIDNVAFNLSVNGYLPGNIERIAIAATKLKLPKKESELMSKLDSGLFLLTYFLMVVCWSATIALRVDDDASMIQEEGA